MKNVVVFQNWNPEGSSEFEEYHINMYFWVKIYGLV